MGFHFFPANIKQTMQKEVNRLAKVALVTDSGANIPRELLKKYSIHTVPFNLIWGSKVYRDGVDIQPQEFYERLTHSKEMPTTSQPSPEAFRHLYTHLLEKGYEILSVHTSALLTGTMDFCHSGCENTGRCAN